jgi:hypothetical protein
LNPQETWRQDVPTGATVDTPSFSPSPPWLAAVPAELWMSKIDHIEACAARWRQWSANLRYGFYPEA